MKYMKQYWLPIIIGVLSTLILACGSTPKSQEEQSGQNEAHPENEKIVSLTPQEMKEFDVETATAGPGTLQLHVELPGEVIIPPHNLAHIHPRFPGIVKEVRKSIGDKVKKGEVLAVIESNESMSDYAIKSLINGTVIEMHITRGEMVDDIKHGFVVADLSKVWVYLQVYQKDLPYVHKGQQVWISAGKSMPQQRGVISYISPIIDETTRTAEARVVLDNAKGIWKPGLFVTGRIITTKVHVPIIVPKTALETMDNQTVIFVKRANGFQPQPVEIGRENDQYVEILHGLKSGQIFVSKNGFILKAELLKSEFGDDEH